MPDKRRIIFVVTALDQHGTPIHMITMNSGVILTVEESAMEMLGHVPEATAIRIEQYVRIYEETRNTY